jgi:hypothetical protein
LERLCGFPETADKYKKRNCLGCARKLNHEDPKDRKEAFGRLSTASLRKQNSLQIPPKPWNWGIFVKMGAD